MLALVENFGHGLVYTRRRLHTIQSLTGVGQVIAVAIAADERGKVNEQVIYIRRYSFMLTCNRLRVYAREWARRCVMMRE